MKLKCYLTFTCPFFILLAYIKPEHFDFKPEIKVHFCWWCMYMRVHMHTIAYTLHLCFELGQMKTAFTHERPKLEARRILEVKSGGLKRGFSWKHMASMSDPLHSVAIYWCLCAVEWVLSHYSQATSPDSPHPLLSLALSLSLSLSLPRAGQAQLSDQNQSHFKGRAS